jgi:hypothetical protein
MVSPAAITLATPTLFLPLRRSSICAILTDQLKSAHCLSPIVAMSVHACPDCGGAVFFGAKRCSYCHPAKKLDRMELAVTAGLLSAIALGAAYVGYLLAHDPNRPSLDAIVSAVSRLGRLEFKSERKEDYGWIAKAMQACRQDAGRQPASLHFLVVPVALMNKQDVRWATKSTATAGNAELLSLNDTLDGLRKGDLQLYSGDYAFSITSVPANVIYKWASGSGASRFSTDEAEQIPAFKIGFQFGAGETDLSSATEMKPSKGNCQWTGALITQ